MSIKKVDASASHKPKAKTPPWERKNPKGKQHKPMDAKTKAAAKERARKAGRPYPNLVDNMNAIKAARK